MNGTRLPDGQAPKNPGEYAWMPYEAWEDRPSFLVGDGEWHIVDPTGGIGAAGRHWRETQAGGLVVEHLPAHTWQVHDDRSVTFNPSLVMPSGWHGWLRAGVFT